MAISSKPNSRYQIRSISLPCRSHPTIHRIEQELNNLKTWEASYVPTERSICDGLTRLALLYKCLDNLFNLPTTQQALCHHQDQKWVEGLLDGSVKLLDICGLARDKVVQTKELIRDIQCALRRRKGDLSIESSIAKYASLRKKTRKGTKHLIAGLKQINDTNCRSLVLEQDHHLISVIKVVMEVSEMTGSVFESLFTLLFTIKPKSSRCSIVLKFMQKGRVACEDQQQGNVNELDSVDVALLNLIKDGSSDEGETMQIAQNRLEVLEAHIEGMDSGLECIFRGLIRTRSLLLNIVSQ